MEIKLVTCKRGKSYRVYTHRDRETDCVCVCVCDEFYDRNRKTRTYDLCQSSRSFGRGISKLLIYKVRQNAVSANT